MQKSALAFLLLSLVCPLLQAGASEDWAIGVGTGPFIFGSFAETRSTITNGEDRVNLTNSLSASTRAGLVLTVERFFNDRLSLRVESAGTSAPLAVKTEQEGSEGSISLDVGDINVLTFAIPLTFRFNRGGSFRPLIFAGPAYAMYDIDRNENIANSVPLFEGTRGRLGAQAGAGLEWRLHGGRFFFRAEIADLITESPLKKSDFSGTLPRRLELNSPHNVHTSLGINYRF